MNVYGPKTEIAFQPEMNRRIYSIVFDLFQSFKNALERELPAFSDDIG
jgi:hypothetical protein